MTATNHVLAGALLAAFLPLPVAIPIAIASHFVMDAIPHYGIEDSRRDGSGLYKTFIAVDGALALSITGMIVAIHQWHMFACGAAAFLPDFIWIFKYFRQGKTLDLKHGNRFTRFHGGIQHERPLGIVSDLSFFVITAPIFIKQILK